VKKALSKVVKYGILQIIFLLNPEQAA